MTEAVARLRAGERPAPYAPALPMTVSIRMASPDDAARAAQRPTVRRVDEVTVEGVVERRCDVLKWLNGTGLD